MNSKLNKRKRPVRGKRIGNLYLRRRPVKPEEFLRLVDGRDKPQFLSKFARWLADDTCAVSLVRLCFEGELERKRLAWREELYSAELRVQQRASRERDPKRRHRLFREVDRLLPTEGANIVAAELYRRTETFHAEHTKRLVQKLSARRPVEQVRYLDNYLRHRKLLPPAEPASLFAPVPKAWRGTLTNRPPRSISLSEVEDAYYDDHPGLLRHEERARHLIHDIEFGGELAHKMARSKIPGDADALEELGQALAVIPELGECPKPVWAALCNYCEEIGTGDKKRSVRANYLRSFLKTAFERDAAALRRFVATALLQHIEWLDRIELGHFRAARLTARKILAEIACLARGNRERAKGYRQFHRSARHAPKVVRALRDFFFDGLPTQELRLHRGLLAKLMPALKKEVTHLGRFRFLRTSQSRVGLIPRALKLDAPGSQFRRKLAMYQTWPERVLLRRREKMKDAELTAAVDRLAGVPEGRMKSARYVRAAERLREREN